MPRPGYRSRASIAARTPSSVNVGGSRTSTIARSGLWPPTMRSRPGAVLGLGDDVDVVLAQQRDDALAQQGLVLGDHDAHGSSARIVVPAAGRARDREAAVERLDAVAQAGEAAAVAGRRRRARRRRSTTSRRSVVEVERHRAPTPRRVLGDVRQRLGDDEVRRGLDHRQRAATARPRRPRPGSPSAGRAPRRRRREAAVGEDRRGDPAREVAQLGDRGARLVAGAAEHARRPRAGRRACPRRGRAACSARRAAPGRRRGGRARSAAARPPGRRARRAGCG